MAVRPNNLIALVALIAIFSWRSNASHHKVWITERAFFPNVTGTANVTVPLTDADQIMQCATPIPHDICQYRTSRVRIFFQQESSGVTSDPLDVAGPLDEAVEEEVEVDFEEEHLLSNRKLTG
jgi:hypothetical protein